jgi:hypothetical protein
VTGRFHDTKCLKYGSVSQLILMVNGSEGPNHEKRRKKYLNLLYFVVSTHDIPVSSPGNPYSPFQHRSASSALA